MAQRTVRAGQVSLAGGVLLILVALLSGFLPEGVDTALLLAALTALCGPMVVVAWGVRRLLEGEGSRLPDVALAAALVAPAAAAVFVGAVAAADTVATGERGLKVVAEAAAGLALMAAGVFVGLETGVARRAGYISGSIWWLGAPIAILFVFPGALVALGEEPWLVVSGLGLVLYLVWCLALPRMLAAAERGARVDLLPDDVAAAHPAWLAWTAYLSAASIPFFAVVFTAVMGAYGASDAIPPEVVVIVGLAAILVFAAMTAVGIGLERMIEGGVASLLAVFGLAVGAAALLCALVITYLAAIQRATSAPEGWLLAMVLVPVGYGAWLVMANLIAMRNGHLVGRLPQLGMAAGAGWMLTAAFGVLAPSVSFLPLLAGTVGYLGWSVWLGRSLGARRPALAATRRADPASASH
jgi:hypothetical protein